MGRPPKTEVLVNKRQEILDTAYEIIMEKGINNTSVADIVERVGISKGTYFYYYKAKDQMIYDLTMQHLNQLSDYFLEQLSSAQGTKNSAQLLTEVLSTFVHAESPGKLNLYLIYDAVTGNDELRECFRNQYLQWQKSLAAALTKGAGLGDKFSRELSFIIPALIDGLTIQWLLGIKDIPIADIAERIMETK